LVPAGSAASLEVPLLLWCAALGAALLRMLAPLLPLLLLLEGSLPLGMDRAGDALPLSAGCAGSCSASGDVHSPLV
jgi:hypothetical protein